MNFWEIAKQSFTSTSDEEDEWLYPQKEEELKHILSETQKPVFIYKHSNTCATSLFALRHVKQVMSAVDKNAVFCFIDVRKNRYISNLVSDITGVKHESPQVLLVLHGNVQWSASHGAVQASAMHDVFNSL